MAEASHRPDPKEIVFSLKQEVILPPLIMNIDDLHIYESLLAIQETVSVSIEKHMDLRPLKRKPKFALWGARGRYVQIGSAEEKSMKRRMGGKLLRIDIPKVRWTNGGN